MSEEPPFSGRPTESFSARPTGPPHGPLSGDTPPPTGPPTRPTGGGPGGDGGEPHPPWWRSASRMAVLTGVVVLAVVLGLVFLRPGGGSSAKGPEVVMQPAGEQGQDPYTQSTANQSSIAPVSPSPGTSSGSTNVLRGVSGGAPGLYGGTRDVASCDVEKQIRALRTDSAKNRAFASVAGVQPAGVPAYLRSLTPVQLRADTRVTNHGYRDGAPTAYQAVLQAGTAVLIDAHGVPRVRCACGNPLTQPVAQQTTPRLTGPSWPSFRPSNVVVVTPTVRVVKVFVIFDPRHDTWFQRHRGDDTGHHDRPTGAPAHWTDPVIPPRTPPPPPCTASPGTRGTPCALRPNSPSPSGPSSSGPGASHSSPSSSPPSASSSSASPSSPSSSGSSPSSSPSSSSPGSGSPSSPSPSSGSASSGSPSSGSPSSESASTGASSPGSPAPGSSAPETSVVPETSGQGVPAP